MDSSNAQDVQGTEGALATARAKSRFDPLWAKWADLSVRHARLVAVTGLTVLLLGVPWAAKLYADLRTDLRELLPQGAPAAVGLSELEKRLGGLAALAVVVRTDDFDAGAKFVDALAAKLQALPREVVARVAYRVDAERDFFEKHGALYADQKDLDTALAELKKRVLEEKRKANPLAVSLDDDEDAQTQTGTQAQTGTQSPTGTQTPAGTQTGTAAPLKTPPELEAPLKKLKDALGQLDHFPRGYLAGEGGTTFVLLLSPSGAAVNLADNQRMVHAVEAAVADLDPHKFHPSIRVGYGGEVRTVIEAQEALIRDL
ncbi:MAG: hypothetical protein JST92_15495, partial [Deltaproteobacteria bacterium]|nr:hypothetical protein [Deltaproteobacteria bacterium]